ncbi:hypothetical protein N5079_12790 [Planotetraspora sp. A-T 1434]|uniref:hypothetical protein n=1 Tax=Planotetraspora sp. A-T 1434 TaxID=2979219 RepID=UPI0021C0E3CB|nr:hypothetical protein [Planotetraspora sp. A-T 1434]MCT9931093.1 hypothetical protein [Planotetraspora sp. A-T 1434]
MSRPQYVNDHDDLAAEVDALRPRLVGVAYGHAGRPGVALTVAGGRITAIDLVMNPEKLARVSRTGNL